MWAGIIDMTTDGCFVIARKFPVLGNTITTTIVFVLQIS